MADPTDELTAVTHPTICRRWRSKESLTVAAVNRLHAVDPPVETVDTGRDPVSHFEDMARTFDRFYGLALLGILLAEHDRHPELLAQWTQRLAGPCRDQIRAILDRGKERRHLQPSLDTTAAAWMHVGAYYALHTTGYWIRSADLAQRVVDTIIAPGHTGQSVEDDA